MHPNSVIVGVDEAGRGAIAGPVVAGACILPEGKSIPTMIRDSKMLTPEKREKAYAWIEEHCISGYGIVDAKQIDAHGILACTEKAMQEAVAEIAKHITPTYLLVDGRDAFWFDYPKSSIIKGDEKEPCISAASIVAKVTRDRIMIDYARTFPQYHFSQHKGYGTSNHIECIENHGPCTLHRNTFLTRIVSKASAI